MPWMTLGVLGSLVTGSLAWELQKNRTRVARGGSRVHVLDSEGVPYYDDLTHPGRHERPLLIWGLNFSREKLIRLDFNDGGLSTDATLEAMAQVLCGLRFPLRIYRGLNVEEAEASKRKRPDLDYRG